MIKFKIVFGSIQHPADESINQWLNEHKDIHIIDFKYQQARMGDHSICIEYEELK